MKWKKCGSQFEHLLLISVITWKRGSGRRQHLSITNKRRVSPQGNFQGIEAGTEYFLVDSVGVLENVGDEGYPGLHRGDTDVFEGDRGGHLLLLGEIVIKMWKERNITRVLNRVLFRVLYRVLYRNYDNCSE